MLRRMPKTIDPCLGNPGDRVTHWGISRVVGKKRDGHGNSKPVCERITHPRSDGVKIREWPIEELTLEIVRDRWGAGEYRCHWFEVDSENEDNELRRKPAGHGNYFELVPVETEDDDDAPAAAPLPPMPGA